MITPQNAISTLTNMHSPTAVAIARLIQWQVERIAELARERDEARRNRDRIVDNFMAALQSECGADHSKADIDEFRGCVVCQRARIAELEAENARMRHWVNTNMTYYDVIEGDERPMLQSVSKRIWYHATDDRESWPFAELIDAAEQP